MNKMCYFSSHSFKFCCTTNLLKKHQILLFLAFFTILNIGFGEVVCPNLPFRTSPNPLDVGEFCTIFPYILHPTSYILHPTSYILHLTSYILHPTSYILHLTSYILHPTSYILHPTSYILHLTSLS